MMHGFGFGLPLFMGGPLVWILVLVGGYLLVRKLFIPNRYESDRRPGVRDHDDDGDSRRLAGSRSEISETEIYRLAARQNGTVTVSDLVTELGIEPKQAEKKLESMSDGVRVRMEVSAKGIVYYIFTELQK